MRNRVGRQGLPPAGVPSRVRGVRYEGLLIHGAHLRESTTLNWRRAARGVGFTAVGVASVMTAQHCTRNV